MLRCLLLIVAVVAGGAALTLAYLAARPEKELGLAAAEAVHDFGELSQGDKVTFEFELVNQWDQPVKIRNIIKDCGCTKAECSRKEIGPGERASIEASWEVGAPRGPSHVRLTVLAALPDDRVDVAVLQMRATVVPDVLYEPEKLAFSRQSATRKVVFSAGRLSEFKLKRAYCTHKAFNARLLPNGAQVEVSYDSNAMKETIPETYLIVETTSPHEPACHIPLTAVYGGKAG